MGVKLDLTLREEQRLRVFDNTVLRRIFERGARRQRGGENCITKNLMTCNHHQILSG
jgi:hypothetical protein